MPALIECQHVVGVGHSLAKGVPGVGIALKTVQQHERGIAWGSPLDVMQLQPVDGDKLILSKRGHAHSAHSPASGLGEPRMAWALLSYTYTTAPISEVSPGMWRTDT